MSSTVKVGGDRCSEERRDGGITAPEVGVAAVVVAFSTCVARGGGGENIQIDDGGDPEIRGSTFAGLHVLDDIATCNIYGEDAIDDGQQRGSEQDQNLDILQNGRHINNAGWRKEYLPWSRFAGNNR